MICKIILQKYSHNPNFFLTSQIQEDQRQAQEEQIYTDVQLGFRRMLAGIYAHTSAHIVAAPMAHHMALHGSRFQYSHDYGWLPAQGVLSILEDAKMIMRFRQIQGKQVVYHSAMNYIYRPTNLENLCLYKFIQDYYCTSRLQAKKENLLYYDFPDIHPCSSVDVIVKRTRSCIPVFTWNWLDSPADFKTSILTSSSESDSDYHMKERYAKKFMILFLPFRMDDLKIEKGYQKKLIDAYTQKMIDTEMIEIAENIMAIQNSLESALVDNPLLATTYLEEAEDVEVQDDQDDEATQALLTSIANYFASTSGDGPKLTQDAKFLSPKFVKKSNHTNDPSSEPSQMATIVLEDVIPAAASEVPCSGTDKCGYSPRFCSSISELNALSLTQFLARNENSSDSRNIIHANGSWRSIIAWGIEAKLDQEQQVAFEILVATYVLTFYEEAEDRSTTEEERENFSIQINKLKVLARQTCTNEGPLRLFVTGPAGAGKCEY